MNRKQKIKEITLVQDYSRKVYGSCTQSYMGCLADAQLLSIVGGGSYGGMDRKPYSVLFEEATDEQIDKAHEYVTHWIPIARDYLAVKSRLSRAFAQLT